MSRWIDTSGTYPVMRAKLPRLALQRYQQMLFDQGIYPLGGRVRALGKSGVSPREAIGADSRAQRAKEMDREYRRMILEKIGLAGANPDQLQLVQDSPGMVRSREGVGPSPWDPQRVGDLSRRFVRQSGWKTMLDIVDVKNHWEKYVGPQLGAHTKVESYREGRLVVRTDSTAWATQLKMLLPTLEKKLAQRLGPDTVRQVIIRGPLGPSWKFGARSVPGRGPRDTYG